MAPSKTSSCQTDETQSWLTIWLVPRLFGVPPTRWHAVLCADVSRSAVPPRVPSGACASAFLSTCFAVNRPVRLCTVSYRGQSKECKKRQSVRPPESQSEFYGLPCQRHSAGQSIIALWVTGWSFPGPKCQYLSHGSALHSDPKDTRLPKTMPPQKREEFVLNPWYVHFSSPSSQLTFACCSATKNTLPGSPFVIWHDLECWTALDKSWKQDGK